MRKYFLVAGVSFRLSILGDLIKNYTEITLKSLDKGVIPVTWDLLSRFSANETIKGLEIATTLEHNVRGVGDYFQIKFENGFFFDSGHNELRVKSFETPATRQLYIQPALSAAGASFLGLTYATFIITVGVNPFKSKPPFWIFMSMIQMLSFTPVLNCEMPSNLEEILTKYFGVSKSSIPFDDLPTWVPNPRKFIAKFKTDPLNSKFDNAGYASISFLYNFSDQLGTWIILTLAYFLIHLAGEAIPSKLY